MIKGNREQLLKLVDAFPGHKVMVVGDVMIAKIEGLPELALKVVKPLA